MKDSTYIYKYDATNWEFVGGNEMESVHLFLESLKNKNDISWLNFYHVENQDAINLLISELKLEKSIIDEAKNDFKRSKLEEFDNYLFFKIKSILPQENRTHLAIDKMSFVLGEDYLISFQEQSAGHFVEVRSNIENKTGKIRTKKADYLLYKLLDAIVDNYFETMDDITDQIESIDQTILAKTTFKNISVREYLRQIEIQKRRLNKLRRIVVPLKDVASQMQHTQSPLLRKENKLYISKINESCTWILEEIDASKQVLEGLANICFSINDQKMNEIMKLLTLVGSIFIPLTFIVGVYGMNFKYMPELEMKNGYWIVLGSMVLIAISMVFYFYKRGWFKKDA